jgi:hypothetical protein
MPDGDVVAQVRPPGRAHRARRQPAGGTGEHRVEHHPGAARQVVAVVEQLADHLVAGTNGIDTSAEKYSDVEPVTAPRSDPQMPESSGRTRAQPACRTTGSSRVTSRTGAIGPTSSPGMREPTARAAA